MSDTGWKSPSSTIDQGSDWSNVNNLKANDGAYATANTLMGDSTSNIHCTGFGFDLPISIINTIRNNTTFTNISNLRIKFININPISRQIHIKMILYIP